MGRYAYARGRVSGPAIGLLATAGLSGVLLCLALAFDVWFVASGAIDDQRPGPVVTTRFQVGVRVVWSLLMLAAHLGILFGALQMLGLRRYGAARTACWLAVVPCVGPCFVLGVPFGIWGLMVLADPRVGPAFEAD